MSTDRQPRAQPDNILNCDEPDWVRLDMYTRLSGRQLLVAALYWKTSTDISGDSRSRLTFRAGLHPTTERRATTANGRPMTNPIDDPEDWADVTGPDGTCYSFRTFHPLDHQPWHPRCRTLPGGWRQHLRVWKLAQWQMYYRVRLLRRPHQILCWLGRHAEYRGHIDNCVDRRGFFVGCEFCAWTRPATEDEWFHFPGDGGILGGRP